MYLIGLVSSYVEYVMIRWPDYLVNNAIFVEVSVYRERERVSYCSTHLDCSLIVHKECHFKVEFPCPKSKVSKMCL